MVPSGACDTFRSDCIQAGVQDVRGKARTTLPWGGGDTGAPSTSLLFIPTAPRPPLHPPGESTGLPTFGPMGPLPLGLPTALCAGEGESRPLGRRSESIDQRRRAIDAVQTSTR